MMLITTTADLAAFCQRNARAPFLTVDTEFMRERTFYARLCLIQVASETEAVAIDPLADGIDLQSLLDLLDDPNIVKVFHAARQDVEIFFQMTGRVPQPMFDTQVAAMVCGYGDAASYETLASSLAGARIDKSSRFTDWARRPLSDKQLDYALGDVTHLREVYRKLRARLEADGRGVWVDEEMSILTDPATYTADPVNAWKRLKLRSDKPRQRALAQELAAWRDEEARRVDVPRSRILRDEALLEIVYHPPEDAAALGQIRGLGGGFANSRQGGEILQAVARALARPAEDCPPGEDRRVVPGGLGPVVDLLKVVLKQVSEEHGVATRLIADTDDLEDIAINDEADVPALRGWRRELFGEQALALKHGKLTLGLKGRKVVMRSA